MVGLLVAIVVAESLFFVTRSDAIRRAVGVNPTAPSGPVSTILILVGAVAFGLWVGRVVERRE